MTNRFPRELWNIAHQSYGKVAFAKALLQYVGNHTTENAYKVEQAAVWCSTPEQQQQLFRELREHPDVAEMMSIRRQRPPQYAVEDLRGYKPGTLGYAYYRHMTDNRLSIHYYNIGEDRDDPMVNLRLHAMAMHDIHHPLLGYDVDTLGEVGILSFYHGNYHGNLGSAAPTMMAFTSILVAAVLLSCATKRPAMLGPYFDQLATSWQLGKNAKLLLPIRFEEYWQHSLVDLRRELQITPVSTIYDFA